MNQYVRRIKNWTLHNRNAINTTVSIVGVAATAYYFHKAAPISRDIILGAEYNEKRELTCKEKLALTWKVYIPAVSATTFTVLAIINNERMHVKHNAAMAASYAAVETAFKEYQRKIIRNVGDEVHRKVADEVTAKNPNMIVDKDNNTTIIMTGSGKVPFKDDMSGQVFESTVETVRGVVNDLYSRMRTEMNVTVNDFYEEFPDLEAITLGDTQGWNNENPIEIGFSSRIINGIPHVVIYSDPIDLS